MRSFASLLICCILILSVTCSSTKVHFDYDRQEDFTQYRTYNFIPVPEELGTEVSPMVIRRIEEAIALALGDKGFNRTDVSPDFLVAIHLESKDKFDVQHWGYSYAPYDLYYRGAGYWGSGGITDGIGKGVVNSAINSPFLFSSRIKTGDPGVFTLITLADSGERSACS